MQTLQGLIKVEDKILMSFVKNFSAFFFRSSCCTKGKEQSIASYEPICCAIIITCADKIGLVTAGLIPRVISTFISFRTRKVQFLGL